MQKEWKALTAFRWQSDGWAGRLQGKCSRGLLSGHTRAPFNKVQRWAAPQHIAGEWEGGRVRLTEAHAFSRGSLPVMPASLGFLTCAREQRLEILRKNRSWRGFRDLKKYLPLHDDTRHACDTLTPLSLHERWISCNRYFIFTSAATE